MARHITVALVLCACAMLASAEYDFGFGFSDGYLATNFGSPTLNALSSAGARDPRANTGPVVFPASPPGDPSQTSGVVVGASGYGFQPPGAQAWSCHSCGTEVTSRRLAPHPIRTEGLHSHKSSYETRHKRKLCAFPFRRA